MMLAVLTLGLATAKPNIMMILVDDVRENMTFLPFASRDCNTCMHIHFIDVTFSFTSLFYYSSFAALMARCRIP